MNIAGTVNL